MILLLAFTHSTTTTGSCQAARGFWWLKFYCLIYSWTSVKQCFFTISSLFKLWEYPSYSHRKKLNPSKILIYINKFHIKQELINIFRWQYTLSKYSINRLYHSGLEHENYKSFKKSSVYDLQIWYLHSRVKQITSITTCILF